MLRWMLVTTDCPAFLKMNTWSVCKEALCIKHKSKALAGTRCIASLSVPGSVLKELVVGRNEVQLVPKLPPGKVAPASPLRILACRAGLCNPHWCISTELSHEHPVLPFCAQSVSGLVSSSCGHSPLEDAGVLESDIVTRYLHARAGLSFGLLEAVAHSWCGPRLPSQQSGLSPQSNDSSQTLHSSRLPFVSLR
jgi:hypothetical protein